MKIKNKLDAVVMGKILRALCLFVGLFMVIAALSAIYYLFISKTTPPVFLKKILEGALSGDFSHTNWETFQIDKIEAVVGVLFSSGIGLLFLWAAFKLLEL